MRDPESIDLSTINWRRLTPAQREQVQQQIVGRAQVARARALQDLVRLPFRLLRHGIAVLWRRAVDMVERQRAMQELSTLDDRSLRDIGLSRADIESAVRGLVPRAAWPGEPFAALPRPRPARQQRSQDITPESKRLIKETWALVVPIADTAAQLFYNRLFEIDPSTRALFKTTNMAEQRKKLMHTLTVALQSLDKLEALIPVVENLGRRHVGYGVTAAHYESVGAALLWTLEQALGKAWTPEAAAAWTELYGVLSAVMRRAANEAQPQPAQAA